MKVLKTIFRAFLFGVGVGILMAPRAGSETRRMLSEKLNNVLEGAGDLADKLDRSSSEGDTSGMESREVGSAASI
ncbi:MAG TPA: YtxH domain-containing protein [Herpetosiphonaceae bacterium]